ncbi:VOC family protein [Piscinibacter sakaiensis]|uniref:Lactoylglutathione lyase n=1 Tax=Piscinibacter sakaiensis TaxID=1547922 RepID=A0A0K8NXA2_PISS1|nr:VOC family protein [Piscinibacter sakaiensis]GAP35006.1 lactoylglutathione lyase [Piscinibacter sakaiensis]
MFDHVVLSVSDLAAARDFFLRALEPLGVALVADGPQGVELCRLDSVSSLCLRRDATPTTPPLHLAFTAQTRAQVQAFHRLALAAGGRDHGAPGLRPVYGPTYYAAFVIGPDGHNVEVVCHAADT